MSFTVLQPSGGRPGRWSLLQQQERLRVPNLLPPLSAVDPLAAELLYNGRVMRH